MTMALIPSYAAQPLSGAFISSTVYAARKALDDMAHRIEQAESSEAVPPFATIPKPDTRLAAILDRYVRDAAPGEDRYTARQRIEAAIAQGRDAELNLRGLGLLEVPPVLPDAAVLDLSGNRLSQLPPLPCGIKVLLLRQNKFKKLPDILPGRLIKLDVSGNHLTSLPESLPDSLEHIDVHNNGLRELPRKLPRGLRVCNVARNRADLNLEAATRLATLARRRVFDLAMGGPSMIMAQVMKNADIRRCDVVLDAHAVPIETA